MVRGKGKGLEKNSDTKQVVTMDDIYTSYGLDDNVQGQVELTEHSVQDLVKYLLSGIGAVLIVVIILIGVQWMRDIPTPPVLSGTNVPQQIANYKALREVGTENTTKVFDLLVTKGLVPLFTGIVGYALRGRVPDKKK